MPWLKPKPIPKVPFWNRNHEEKGTFGMDFGLGEDIAQHNRIFRWYKSLNILFHDLSIATMLAPNQPYSHSKFTNPTGLTG